MKIFPVVILTLLISFSQSVFAQNLSERRALQSYQESVLPDIQNQINSAAGYELPVNVDWSSIALPGDEDNYANNAYFTDIYFTPLVKALSSVASDDLGKQALLENLKSVDVTYDPDTAPSSNYTDGISFEGGKLTINFKPFSNADDIDERVESMVEVLESNL